MPATFVILPKKNFPDYLQFEHTDGLYYVRPKIAKERLWFKQRFKHLELSTDASLNAGVVVKRSDVTLMHYNRNNAFSILPVMEWG